jgi:sugar lactone lactonase YvrE
MRKINSLSIAGLASLFWIMIWFSGCEKAKPAAVVTPPPSSPPPAPAKKWIVSTLAGSGTAGYKDGDTTQAQFNNAQGITIDQHGNLFVGDQGNQAIREISAAGKVSTYISESVRPPSNQFFNIYSIIADNSGNLFDVESSFIRKVASASSLIFAGNDTSFYRDGIGVNAEFNTLGNITIDPQGDLFVPDYDTSNKFHLRKITPAGLVSTLVLQDNTGYSADGLPNYFYLYSIACDHNGNLYVTANGNSMIKKVDAQGNVTVFAGSTVGFTNGKGATALFSTILGMTCDASGNLWVADGDNHAIREVTPDGTVSTIVGTGIPGYADGDSTKAQFRFPYGITIDPNGVVYVMDTGNNRVRKLEYK